MPSFYQSVTKYPAKRGQRFLTVNEGMYAVLQRIKSIENREKYV